MQKELLIFVVLIGIIAALFNVSKTSAELTGNGELQKSDDIIYKAGDHFTLNINAAKTTDLGSSKLIKCQFLKSSS